MRDFLESINWNSASNEGAINFRPCCEMNFYDDIPIIWRSGSLERLSLAQIHFLQEQAKINTWFCLMEENERSGFQKITSMINTIYYPLSEDNSFRQKKMPFLEDYVALYWHYLTKCSNTIFDIFKALSFLKNNENVLISCYAGKDRTGLICALINGLLNRDKSVIIADYVLSEMYLQKQIAFFELNWQKRGITPDEYNLRFSGLIKLISQVLEKIEKVYGGISEYLLCIGLDGLSINKIRTNFLGIQ